MCYLDTLTERELQLLVAFPAFIIIAIILGLLILRRDSSYWGNRLFFIVFVVNGLALVFNLLYLFSEVDLTIIRLNIASISCINISVCCLILAILVLYKGENEVIGAKSSYILLLVTGILIAIQAFLPDGVGTMILVDESGPQKVPHWSLHFGLYQILFNLSYFLIFYYYAIRLYREISPEMQKKFKRFLIGGVFVYLTMLSVSINNMRIIPGYEDIAGIFNLGALIGIVLIYYGIVRKS